MPKNIDDMIAPERKRSIRNIPIPDGRKKADRYASPRTDFHEPAPDMDEMPNEPRRYSPPKKRNKKLILISGGAVLLVIVFAFLSFFAGATLSYLPKSQAVSFSNEIFTAKKSGGEGSLVYSVVKLSGDKSAEVAATGEAQVSRKASGTIVVYNDATTESQRLLENTRFETPSGLVYRVPNAIVVPGKTTVGGKSQPGSLEVLVYADEAGDKYNVGLTDFTLPGLKGSSKFNTIYARSKTPMTGGFVGMEKAVNESDKAAAKSNMQAQLTDELVASAQAQAPEGFIVIPALSSINFEELAQTAGSGDNNATLNLRGNFLGVMFNKKDLLNTLTSNKVARTANENNDIVPFDALSFSFASSSQSDLLSADEMHFMVSGDATAVWVTDEVSLKADLAGRSKGDIASVLRNYPTIVSATATVRPFWKSSFPDNTARITMKKLPVK